MPSKYIVQYNKYERRWGVYTADDWICDCPDKETAKMIAKALEAYQGQFAVEETDG